MKTNNNKTITLIEEDRYSETESAMLFEVRDDTKHYYVTATVDIADDGRVYKPISYAPVREKLITREDMTDDEYELAKELFCFLWDSDNGTNTCESYECLEDAGFTQEDVQNFIDKFELENALDLYENNNPEDDGVEIYWEFLCNFDIDSCNFIDYSSDDDEEEEY